MVGPPLPPSPSPSTRVRDWMIGPVVSVARDAQLEEAAAVLRDRGISCVPVIDASNQAVGVLSRTDLLRQANVRNTGELELPQKSVGDAMHPRIVTVEPDQPISYAARRMISGGFHRVFVHEGGKLVGVVSTRELMACLARQALPWTVEQLMTGPIACIRQDAPWPEAAEVLRERHVTAVVVVADQGWPVGMVTQRDALLARAHPPTVPCEAIMTRGVLCVTRSTPASSAASQAYASDFRRVLVADPPQAPEASHRVVGIVTGTDFARALQ